MALAVKALSELVMMTKSISMTPPNPHCIKNDIRSIKEEGEGEKERGRSRAEAIIMANNGDGDGGKR